MNRGMAATLAVALVVAEVAAATTELTPAVGDHVYGSTCLSDPTNTSFVLAMC